MKTIFEQPNKELAKECSSVAKFLIESGHLSKCYGVAKKFGKYGRYGSTIQGYYYVAFYNHGDLLKYFDESSVFNGLPIFVHPFFEQKVMFDKIISEEETMSEHEKKRKLINDNVETPTDNCMNKHLEGYELSDIKRLFCLLAEGQ